MRVGFIGECMAELKKVDGNLEEGFAGDTFNSAVYLTRTFPQLESYFISAVGSDALSKEMLDFAQCESINTRFLFTHPDKHIGLYKIYTDAEGERSFTYWRNDSAAKCLMSLLADGDKASMTALDLVLFSGISLAILNKEDLPHFWRLLTTLKESGTQIVFDMNHRPALWKGRDDAIALYEKAFEIADIALPGLEDFNFLYGFETMEEVLKFLAPFSFKQLVIKNGSRAVTLVDEKGEVSVVGLTPVADVVDTTSAGDAFNGVFLGAYLTGESPEASVEKAAKCAGFVIQHPGAIVDKAAYAALVSSIA
ncbi:sugar kinase [Alteromonas sp. S015]|uniref:sugar kinase n=1 Tax=Alteromonas sp. S015 TaxID=3117401 RepID=UPI002FDF94D1